MESKKPRKLDIIKLFNIVVNNDLKRFEFNSKTNASYSYTVSFEEADDLDDAKIAVYFAVRKNSPHLMEENND